MVWTAFVFHVTAFPLPHPTGTRTYFPVSARLRAVLSKSLIRVRADFSQNNRYLAFGIPACIMVQIGTFNGTRWYTLRRKTDDGESVYR